MESAEDENPKPEDICLELMPLPGTDRDLAEAKRETMAMLKSDGVSKATLKMSVVIRPLAGGGEREVLWDDKDGCEVEMRDVLLRAASVLSDMQRTLIRLKGGLLAAWGLEEQFRSHLTAKTSLRPSEINIHVKHLNICLCGVLIGQSSPEQTILPQKLVKLSPQHVYKLVCMNKEALVAAAQAYETREFKGEPAIRDFEYMLKKITANKRQEKKKQQQQQQEEEEEEDDEEEQEQETQKRGRKGKGKRRGSTRRGRDA